MKILVTGGAGFIGSNVVDAYVNAGHDVVIIDNLFSGKWENINPNATFYLMDIRSPEVIKVFEKEKFDLVNHHAAQISVPASVGNPLFDADINIKGFLNILEAAKLTTVKKVIFISSGGAIYGEAEEFPTSEKSPIAPLSPYAITKYVAEQYLAFYRHQYKLNYTILRYANVYGPRQIPHGEAGVVALFMDRLLAGQQCTVYHYPEEPKGMMRDYCFVEDIIQANLLALEKGNGAAYNIGTGIETHTTDLFMEICKALDKHIPVSKSEMAKYNMGDARPGDLKKSCLNCKKAQTELGFTPQHTLAEGLEKTAAWRITTE